MEESVVATRSQPLARITICIHASPRHVSWHACYTCIGRMYVSQGGNVFRKGAKPFRNCFPSPHRPKENPATCSSSTRATDLRQLRDLCKPSLPLDSPLDYFPRSFIDRYLSSPPPIYLSPFIGGKITKQKKYKIGLSNRRLSTRVGNDSVLGKRNSKLVGFVWICRNTGGRNEAVENYYWTRWWWIV